LEIIPENRYKFNTGGGIRTHTLVPQERNLSPSEGKLNPESDKVLTSLKRRLAHRPAHRQESLPPDLALVFERWDALPEAVRAGIVAMVKAASGEGGGA
jgi:hypothetical protein